MDGPKKFWKLICRGLLSHQALRRDDALAHGSIHLCFVPLWVLLGWDGEMCLVLFSCMSSFVPLFCKFIIEFVRSICESHKFNNKFT